MRDVPESGVVLVLQGTGIGELHGGVEDGGEISLMWFAALGCQGWSD